MNLTYQVLQPSAPLKDLLENIWTFGTDGESSDCSSWQSCPSIGSVELIFQWQGRNTISYAADRLITFPQAYFIRLGDEPIQWAQPGNSKLIGLRFSPAGLIALLDLPPSTFTNGHLDASLVFGHAAVERVLEQLAASQTDQQAVAVAEQFIMSRFHEAKGDRKKVILALEAIRSNPFVSAEVWASKAYVCERQMQRLIKEYLGYRPMYYARMVRFGRVMQEAQKYQRMDVSQMAYQFGYSDQAHLTRDFRQFAGSPPAAFCKQQNWYITGNQMDHAYQ